MAVMNQSNGTVTVIRYKYLIDSEAAGRLTSCYSFRGEVSLTCLSELNSDNSTGPENKFYIYDVVRTP